ncbi:uncharacterized protein L969DRAFT_101415 [Mixia osmundae IAM 14324]|uniref:BAR domain-containing protein n=1 Tax=Mixia osmundae (strain CBS 9802 / IAM 14324 / JCM 22182 / KY 12970) TaxID=764103 RepID=G7DXK9_MIXOS|nr:uncharacterized protein L969DRAFT_101415 [Mixia osmundae IAM 14324]KEI41187.1 hypothetical protein L969DRAFT_101415 [Mixia osmundae IAM 14324]GAA95319.1 hypothetical protein E5Q_01976 [Mixia osmundae IAM 14324]
MLSSRKICLHVILKLSAERFGKRTVASFALRAVKLGGSASTSDWPSEASMSSWKAFQGNLTSLTSGLKNVDLSNTTEKLNKQFATFSQQVRETTGQLEEDGVTELPEEYKTLERKVDALRATHLSLLKITKAYETETYDYPTQINESLTEGFALVSHSLTSWAAVAAKGTNLPAPTVTDKAPEQHKTLSHALSRASANSALELTSKSSQPDQLGSVLQTYAVAQDKVGQLRLDQDALIRAEFNNPWSATLNSAINAAMKARQSVKTARLYLDTCRTKLKNASAAKQEQARLEVEAAEERLVTETEQAIGIMASLLANPEPIKNIAALAKAQQSYHEQAAKVLQGITASLDEASVQADGEYRKSRGIA